jgi:hypothetical protein
MSSEYAPPSGSPVRVQLRRVKGWRMPPNTVKVSRPTDWGNPFAVRFCLSAADAVAAYRNWLTRTEGRHLLPRLRELRGKNLACWCRILDSQNNYCHCHADVLLCLANGMSMEEVRHANLEAWKRAQSTHR